MSHTVIKECIFLSIILCEKEKNNKQLKGYLLVIRWVQSHSDTKLPVSGFTLTFSIE